MGILLGIVIVVLISLVAASIGGAIVAAYYERCLHNQWRLYGEVVAQNSRYLEQMAHQDKELRKARSERDPLLAYREWAEGDESKDT